MSSALHQLASSRSSGSPIGIYSVCSAHPWVIEASMKQALLDDGPLLLEATVNQVNHLGGYTGTTPVEFRSRLFEIAARCGFPEERILLGGDHLGPYPWRHLPADEAMKNAEQTVAAYVRAGFSKVHLDTSMPLLGDTLPLDIGKIAARAARLCAVAERAKSDQELCYIIGSEVPTPGGATEEVTTLEVTTTTAAEETLSAHEQAFQSTHLEEAFHRVIGLVVQPGVEFGNESVVSYDPAKARHLTQFLNLHPTLVFEAHSTDYQPAACYRSLVQDGFAILKIGPQLTFAMREVLLAFQLIEQTLFDSADWSHLSETLDATMLRDPKDWQEHYEGSALKQRRLRRFSYSDRVRYYWNVPAVQASVERLLRNVDQREIPETLLSQYLPLQYHAIREGRLSPHTRAYLDYAIGQALLPLRMACKPVS